MLITAVLFAAALGFVARGLATKPASAEEAGKTSDSFERFRFSFFEDQDFLHNGLDRKSLAKMEGDERKRAEALLIDYLPDMRGVIGLGVLRSKRAEEKLTSLFRAAVAELALAKLHSDSKSSLPLGSIEVGRALWFIDPDPRWVAPLIDILASTG